MKKAGEAPPPAEERRVETPGASASRLAPRGSERRSSASPAFRPYKKASLDLALLGLIAEVPGVSGYDIMKIFDLSMAHYWHAHPTQIYPTLERMEEFGLIKRRNVVQRNRPNKRLYTITPAGERLLIEWLESPFEGINLKHPPLLRCRFLGHLGADGAIASSQRRAAVVGDSSEALPRARAELLRRRQGLSRREHDVLDVHAQARHRLDGGEHPMVRVGNRRDRAQSRAVPGR